MIVTTARLWFLGL